MSTPPYDELMNLCHGRGHIDIMKRLFDVIVSANYLRDIRNLLYDPGATHLVRWMFLNYEGGNHYGKVRNILHCGDCDPVVYNIFLALDTLCFVHYPLSEHRTEITKHMKDFVDLTGCNCSHVENTLRMIASNHVDCSNYELALASQPIVTTSHMSHVLSSIIFPEHWPAQSSVHRHELLVEYALQAPASRISDSDREKFRAYHTWLNGRTLTRELAIIADDYFLGQGDLI